MISAAKQDHIEKTVAYHMNELRRNFRRPERGPALYHTKTHFVINCDNGRTIDFRGDTEVKYADVVSGDIGMTIMVYITGVSRARIGAPIMIFPNPSQSYPINGLQDDVPGASYRSRLKCWND